MKKSRLCAAAVLAGVALGGCASRGERIELDVPNDYKLGTIVEYAKMSFHEDVRDCFDGMDVSVRKYGNPDQLGGYSKETGDVGISDRAFWGGGDYRNFTSAEGVAVHELTHRQEFHCDNFDMDEFMRIYRIMNPEKFPIKAVVESRLSKYPFLNFHVSSETLAYFAQLYVMGYDYENEGGYKVSRDMEDFLSSILITKED